MQVCHHGSSVYRRSVTVFLSHQQLVTATIQNRPPHDLQTLRRFYLLVSCVRIKMCIIKLKDNKFSLTLITVRVIMVIYCQHIAPTAEEISWNGLDTESRLSSSFSNLPFPPSFLPSFLPRLPAAQSQSDRRTSSSRHNSRYFDTSCQVTSWLRHGEAHCSCCSGSEKLSVLPDETANRFTMNWASRADWRTDCTRRDESQVTRTLSSVMSGDACMSLHF